MQPIKRQQFICSVIEKCRETVNCCAHKTSHIKDERCIPRQCRYAPGSEVVDCDPYDPEHPRAPVPVPVAPVKTVETRLKEMAKDKVVEKAVEADAKDATTETTTQEIDIKEAVKKQASSRPANTIKGQKKGGKKA